MLLLIAIPFESTTWIVIMAMMGRFFVSSVYAIITLYTTELFPTEIRNSAVGASSTCGHIGSMIAPFVVDLLVNETLSVLDICILFHFIKSDFIGSSGVVYTNDDLRSNVVLRGRAPSAEPRNGQK